MIIAGSPGYQQPIGDDDCKYTARFSFMLFYIGTNGMWYRVIVLFSLVAA